LKPGFFGFGLLVDLFDVVATYAVTKRLNLTLELPIQYGSRTNAGEHDGVHVHTMRAAGVGDLRLSANFLLLNPDKHPNENISLELGVKAPTGDDAASDYSFRATGPVLRPVDSAIQPGDGGWGVFLSVNAFAKVFKNTYAYASGLYLSNPREFNGVQTVIGDLRNPDGLRTALEGCEVLVHVAADYRLWVRDPQTMYAANVDGTNEGIAKTTAARIVGLVMIDGSPAPYPSSAQRPSTLTISSISFGRVSTYQVSAY